MSDEILCEWQTPGNVPGSFDWWLFGTLGTIAGVGAYIVSNGIPVISALVGLGAGVGSIGLAGSAGGAIAVLGLVGYHLLKPDGCIRSKPQSKNICCSGLVERVKDGHSGWTMFLAPYALGPSKTFDLVLKQHYLHLITEDADFIICSDIHVPLLRCVVKNSLACAAKIGAAIGAVIGAVIGTVVGYMVGAAALAACLAAGPAAPLCMIAALLIAFLVSAAITQAGAMIGGWIGAAIGSIGEDEVEETAKSLEGGTFTTVRGDWTKNPTDGHNELYFVTSLGLNGMVDFSPPYSVSDADDTPQDDCPIIKGNID